MQSIVRKNDSNLPLFPGEQSSRQPVKKCKLDDHSVFGIMLKPLSEGMLPLPKRRIQEHGRKHLSACCEEERIMIRHDIVLKNVM